MSQASHPRALLGGKQLHGAVHDLARSARATIQADVFRLDDDEVRNSLRDAHGRGVKIDLRVDPDTLGEQGLADAARFARVAEYGHYPYKQHAKGIVVDGQRAIVGTDVADKLGDRRIELGVRLRGPAARAFDTLLKVSPADPADARAAAIDAARAAGIVLNDRRLGALGVTDAIAATIDGARSRLVIVTKDFNDLPTATSIAERARAGVDSTVVTHLIPTAQATVLRDAGVDLRVVDWRKSYERGTAIHGSLFAADDQALVTSAFPNSQVLHPNPKRVSRELGVVVAGDLADSFRTALLDAHPHQDTEPGTAQVIGAPSARRPAATP